MFFIVAGEAHCLVVAAVGIVVICLGPVWLGWREMGRVWKSSNHLGSWGGWGGGDLTGQIPFSTSDWGAMGAMIKNKIPTEYSVMYVYPCTTMYQDRGPCVT